MKIRPTDDTVDILPVLSSSVMASGSEAVTVLVRDRLNLLSGEWWENPAWGCEILEMLRASRITEQDVPSISSYLSSYILSTPGVQAVEDIAAAVSGRQFSFSCRVLTTNGSGKISYAISL